MAGRLRRGDDRGVTYCLAMRLDEGLLFMSDSRTNAGVDNVSTFRKLHVLRPASDRLFVLQSAGNLGTTHEVLDRLDRDLAAGTPETLATGGHLFEVALYIGRVAREVVASHEAALGTAATATFIFGGQIAGDRPDIMLIYPAGNYIRASDDLPFLQIGESKYGKFLLEFAVHHRVSLETAGKIALSSMTSTARANLSVGPPYDVAVYRNGALDVREVRIEETSAFLGDLAAVWEKNLLQAVHDLPPLPPEFTPS
jgi:putative proteasome-type protease